MAAGFTAKSFATIACLLAVLTFAFLAGCDGAERETGSEAFSAEPSDKTGWVYLAGFPSTSIRDDALGGEPAPEGFSGGDHSHNWALVGEVVEVAPSSPYVIVEADSEGAGILEPGAITVFVGDARITAPSSLSLKVGDMCEVRYMLPLSEPGYVVADAIEVL